MTDSFITVSQGGPKPEEDIADGVYLLQLTDIKDPRTVTAQRGPNAGKSFDLIDWVFAIDAPGTAYHDRIIDGATNTNSGPKSKMYGWLTAFFGGRPPAVGQQIGKPDLIGRYVLGTIHHDDGGWPQIASLGAVPPAMLQQRYATATGTQLAGASAEATPAAAVPVQSLVEQPLTALPNQVQAEATADPAGLFVGAPAQQPVAAGVTDDLPF